MGARRGKGSAAMTDHQRPTLVCPHACTHEISFRFNNRAGLLLLLGLSLVEPSMCGD